MVKADQRDVYASMRTTALLVWGLVLVSFLAIGNLSYALWSRRHKALLDEFSALGLRYRNPSSPPTRGSGCGTRRA